MLTKALLVTLVVRLVAIYRFKHDCFKIFQRLEVNRNVQPLRAAMVTK